MYPSGQVSKILSIPPSTLRRYVSNFKEYLSDPAKRRYSRIFNDTDIAVLSKIRELTEQGVNLNDIPDHLTEYFGIRPTFPEEEQLEKTALLAVRGLKDHITLLEHELAILREQMNKLAMYQAALIEYQEKLENWEALPNWERIKTERPKRPTFRD